MAQDTRPRVVIIGGGFGGLSAARAFRHTPLDVTLIDRRNFHLFQPLLYQVATGGLSPANIAAPLRAVLRRQKNTRVLLGEVVGIDVERRRVLLVDDEAAYDYLIIATGSRHDYFGHPEWEAVAPGLKTVEDATEIRSRLFLAFETAEKTPSPEDLATWLTFVVVGGGPTGVELAGAIGEIASATLTHDYRRIRPGNARIILVEAADRILSAFASPLSLYAEAALARLGVEVRTSTLVTDVEPDAVVVERAGQKQRLPARTVLWAAGVQASPLGRALGESTGVETDRAGRVRVNPDLTLPGHPEVFIAGDLAAVTQDGRQLPAVAPVAMQQGRYAAEAILARLRGGSPAPFRYRDRGSMATIGRSSAVAEIGRLRLGGFPGWAVWLSVHIMNLAQFENRLLVLIQWAWNYLTRNRSARLITGEAARQGLRRP